MSQVNKYFEDLKKNALFKNIDDICFESINVDDFEYNKFAKGSPVVKQGADADKIYFVLSGSLSVKRKIATGKDIELAIKSSGDYFGELGLITEQKRSATVETLMATEVISLTKTAFSKLIEKYPQVKTNLLSNLAFMVYNLDPRIIYEVIKTNNIKPLNNMIDKQQNELKKLNHKLMGEIEQKTIIETQLTEANQELIIAQKELKHAASTDYLTGIKNRRAMNETIKLEENRQQRNKLPFSFILCDVDNFKQINDIYGHNCGDYILKELAKLFVKKTRKTDTVARWGGDEFLFLLAETPTNGAIVIANKLTKEVANHKFTYCAVDIEVTITMGVAEKKMEDCSEDIIKKADKAMYEGKSKGKNQAVS